MRRWLACLALAAVSGAALTCTPFADALADIGEAARGAAKTNPVTTKQGTKTEDPGYLADRLRRPGFLQGGAEQRSEHAQKSWSHLAETDGAACRAALKESGVKFQPMPDQKAPSAKTGCGIPHGVVVSKGPTGIVYSPPLVVDCSLAAALPTIEAVIQDEANRHLGSPITKVTTLGSYSCRNVRGWKERISQHALGNAIDLASFQPKKGKAASVVRDYKRGGAEPTSKEGVFLGAVFRRLWSDADITRVLGPDWDAAHRDHFHIDRGIRWWKMF